MSNQTCELCGGELVANYVNKRKLTLICKSTYCLFPLNSKYLDQYSLNFDEDVTAYDKKVLEDIIKNFKLKFNK